MKKTTLIVLMAALLSFFAFPSFTSTSEQKVSKKEIPKAIVSKLTALNLKNVLTAYEEEVNANAKYAAYSEQARKEGQKEIALLFRATAKSAEIQAKNHEAVLKKAGISISEVEPKFMTKSTKENLKDAIARETHQIKKMYPQYVICANQAQHEPCNKNMGCAYLISKKHKAFFEKALESLNNRSTDALSEVYFVCPKCGNTYENKVHQFCQFCDVPYWKYLKISD